VANLTRLRGFVRSSKTLRPLMGLIASDKLHGQREPGFCFESAKLCVPSRDSQSVLADLRQVK
jgi:hypothetical protein